MFLEDNQFFLPTAGYDGFGRNLWGSTQVLPGPAILARFHFADYLFSWQNNYSGSDPAVVQNIRYDLRRDCA